MLSLLSFEYASKKLVGPDLNLMAARMMDLNKQGK